MFKKLMKAIKNPKLVLIKILSLRLFRILPDSIYIRLKYRLCMGEALNLKNPKKHGEKFQWLKLYDRNPLYTTLADKYEVREYIRKKIGAKYLVKLYGVYDSFEEIDFNSLPERFVLKPNHTSGDIFICRDKSKLELNKLKKQVNCWLKKNYYWLHREWPYKNIKPRILCEEYLEEETTTSLTDYKFFCYMGVPRFCQLVRDRNTRQTKDLFDENWNLLEVTGLHAPNSPFPHSNRSNERPKQYETMLKLARRLSEDFKFLRVDLYLVKGRIYFGELTLTPSAGFAVFDPPEWNRIIGDYIELPLGEFN